MALLIDIKQPQWLKDEELREQLLVYMPDADIRCADDPGDLEDIDMLTVSDYGKGEALRYPNLKLVQKTGAGVETILADESLPPSIRVTRLRTDTSGHEMAEFTLACVLQEQRHLRAYWHNQAQCLWQAYAPRRAVETTVAVLGLGRIGRLIVDKFLSCDFKVAGWSRTPKDIENVACYAGTGELPAVLAQADYVISVLPSTPDTTLLFNRTSLTWMKPTAMLINVGRGSLVDEQDLIQALDENMLAGAVLDVMQTEPLPPSSPLWRHDKVTLTPHVSGWHLGDAIKDIVENYRRLETGEPLLNQADREIGY
ncbi:MAG: glyoxylate/hydroxypyruvate reductase A [Gammaproteobacteria bacterium]|nr:glyoxylate/hydroxypyruvate reductase A [Gammaproteobacteria bacterium]